MSRDSKTTDFLKECMADALLQLMREKPFEKISIQQIAEKSGISRSTWFRGFSSKEEALTFQLVRLWCRWAEAHHAAVRDRYTMENANGFFRFNYEHRQLLELIYAAGLQTVVYDAFYQVLTPQFGQDPEECYQLRFYSYGLFGLLDEWVKRGFCEAPEDMGRLLYEMMRGAPEFYQAFAQREQDSPEK